MRIGIISKVQGQDFLPVLRNLLKWLDDRNCEVLVEDVLLEKAGLKNVDSASREEMPGMVDVIVVFGGDGTMLSVARLTRRHKARILGVNLGSLGFLTEVKLDELYTALERIFQKKYVVDRRRMLKIDVCHQDGASRTYHALNDTVINKGALARIITLQAFVNEAYIASFPADGLIVSTPTGSTAYSLSAGGPVVYPSLDAIIMTPICPHTLTNRPLVIPGSSEVRVVVKSGEDVMVTVDGQVGVALQAGDEIRCTQSEYRIELIQPTNRGFFDILREKLKWGER